MYNILSDIYKFDYRFYYVLSRIKDCDIKQQIAAIYIFYIELLSIRKKANNDMTALIRYQWWHDNIQNVFDKDIVQNHEILKLIHSLKQYNNSISKDLFLSTIENFEKIHEEIIINNIDELVELVKNKFYALFKLPILISGNNYNIGQIINNAAICFGLHEIIVKINYYISSKINMLPHDFIINIEQNERIPLRNQGLVGARSDMYKNIHEQRETPQHLIYQGYNHENLEKFLIKPLINKFYEHYEYFKSEFNLMPIQNRKNLLNIFLPLSFAMQDIKYYDNHFVKAMHEIKDYRKLNYLLKNLQILFLKKFL